MDECMYVYTFHQHSTKFIRVLKFKTPLVGETLLQWGSRYLRYFVQFEIFHLNIKY